MIITLDLETTGLDSKNDKIIEVALVKIDELTFKEIDRFSTLVNPLIPIPEVITNITNISDSDVAKSPTWSEIEYDVMEFIGEWPILGHNVYFDRDFLLANNIEIENNITLDTFLLANSLNLGEKSLSLESLSESFNLKLEGSHRAINDTIATVKLFEKLISILDKLSIKEKKFFKYMTSKSDDTGFDYIVANYLDSNLELLKSDDFVKLYTNIFPKKARYNKIIKDDTLDIKNIKKSIKKIKGLEIRKNQLDMIDIISKSQQSERKVVIEAPTGVGKTFAYLVPSIFYSVSSGEQVYISTTTKALQDQIYFKDLEFLSNNLKVDFNYSKLKGKNNYIGINSFLLFLGDNSEFSKEKLSFSLKILFWLTKTKYGELEELDFFPKEYTFLKYINADDKITFRSDNKFENVEFSIKARRQARKSNIVVINNNILFQDIIGDNNILGTVENLIIDEAHNLEEVVTSSLKKGFSLKDFEKSLALIENILKKDTTLPESFLKYKEMAIFEMGTIFDLFGSYLNSNTTIDTKYKNVLIKDIFYQDAESLDLMLNSISLAIVNLLDALSVIPDKIYMKLEREMSFCEDCVKILGILMKKESSSEYINIVSYNDHIGLKLEYTVLKPGEYLSKNLWNSLKSCVLTSATLEINNDFDYIKGMLSLDSFTFSKLDTDFDYNKQALLFIPNDLGSIKNNFSSISEFLYKLFIIVRGNTLVLFTAFFLIKELNTNLFRGLKNNGITMYSQGIGGGKHKLIDFFKKNCDNSILVGTDTFWQGIDISGEDLKYLVIHKIPFMVPSDPIFQARSKLFKDSFKDYSIPKSIIKLKQGFGRLIRTKDDKGVVIFLDDRIYSTGWGKIYYDAFPCDIKNKIGNSDSFLESLKTNLKH